MNPQWITALIAGAGLAGNCLWTLINLRIENRILTRVDEVKEWADARFVHKPDSSGFSALSQQKKAAI